MSRVKLLTSRSRNDEVWVLSIFGLVGLLFLAVAGYFGWRQHQIVATWPTVQATVTQSRLIIPKPGLFGAEYTFRYEVNGQTYSIQTGPEYQTSSRTMMAADVAHYSKGSRHTIRYNPVDPAVLVLGAGYTFGFFMVPLILGLLGVIFLVIFIGPMVYSRVKRNRKPTYWTHEEHFSRDRKRPVQLDYMSLGIGGFFAAIGVVMLTVSGLAWNSHRARTTWPETQATVTRSRIISYTINSSSSGSGRNSTRTSSRRAYAIELEFEYTIDGKKYTVPATAEDDTSSEFELEDKMPKYKPGTKHIIKYNPASPDGMDFQPKFPIWVWIVGGMGVMFFGMGTLCMVVLGRN